MFTSRGMTNAILIVIAVCLVSIAAQNLFPEANAQARTTVQLHGCFIVPVDQCKWIPVRVDEYGAVLIVNRK